MLSTLLSSLYPLKHHQHVQQAVRGLQPLRLCPVPSTAPASLLATMMCDCCNKAGMLVPLLLLQLRRTQALSNISRFMESRQTSPPEFTVHASVRVLTRVFPALLSDPGLRNWCWRRRP